ncbi:MAG: hypothetical protein ACR2PB_11845 [Desulfocapsaceae bacterium]
MTRINHIRWNHLHLDIPQHWDVIVKDRRHLILENDLKPIAELRWQPPGKNTGAISGEKIARQLAGKSCTKRGELSGLLPASLRTRFAVETYSLDHSIEDTVLLLSCNSCTTTLLLRVYGKSVESFRTYPFVLESLNCHPDKSEIARWQIQDFFFSLPEGFELERSSFRFGLTTLCFNSTEAELILCRLAPASQHLQHSSLSALFQSFCSALPEHQVVANPSTLFYHYEPKLAEYLWSRIRRKKVYQTSSFVHFPHYDRILGYSIRSKRPIETWVKAMIDDGYGIIQQKKAANLSDA